MAELARRQITKLAENICNDALPPLGFFALLGSDFQAMAQKQRPNLDEHRIALAQVIAKNKANTSRYLAAALKRRTDCWCGHYPLGQPKLAEKLLHFAGFVKQIALKKVATAAD